MEYIKDTRVGRFDVRAYVLFLPYGRSAGNKRQRHIKVPYLLCADRFENELPFVVVWNLEIDHLADLDLWTSRIMTESINTIAFQVSPFLKQALTLMRSPDI